MGNITSEHPYSEDNYEGKFQDKISPSDQSFGKKKNNNNIVQERTTNGTKQVLIITH